MVSTGQVYQGGAVRVALPGALSATASILGRTVAFVSTSEGPVAFMPFGVADPPGAATLTIDAIDPIFGPIALDRPITILETDWTVDYIWLPPGTGADDGEDPADYQRRVQEEITLLAETYARVSPRAWDETWLVPVEAPVSGYFGEQRSFNGGPVGGHHGGTDFGAAQGAEVRSTNAGTVVVARDLAVHGNMVIVDHGAGILSGYAHLSDFAVTEGDPVGKGQTVGKVGSTGLSTGPHLHWELSVYGVLVDGLRWLDGSQGF